MIAQVRGEEGVDTESGMIPPWYSKTAVSTGPPSGDYLGPAMVSQTAGTLQIAGTLGTWTMDWTTVRSKARP